MKDLWEKGRKEEGWREERGKENRTKEGGERELLSSNFAHASYTLQECVLQETPCISQSAVATPYIGIEQV